ncbi:MAG: 50S ribosomal protein L9, partial [Gammaproteobacteria bacterium]
GDMVNVKSGYGRNYLIPQGKAKPATPENIAELEARREVLERVETEALTRAENRKAQLDGVVLEIPAAAGLEGKLFGSIGTVDIAEALMAKGIEIERKEVRMPHGPIRVVGEHNIDIHLHTDINVPIKVNVVETEEQV